MEQGIDQTTGDLSLWELMKRAILKNDMCLESLLDIRGLGVGVVAFHRMNRARITWRFTE